MHLIIGHGRLFTGVGVAIFAEVGACVILTNVFALHAAAEVALTFVAVVASGGVGAVVEEYGIRWDGLDVAK